MAYEISHLSSKILREDLRNILRTAERYGVKLLAAAAGDHNAEFDQLSRLPEHLIHRVLSRLSIKEILKAHAVCKSWRRIFSSFPELDIRYVDLVGIPPTMEKEYVQGRVERMARFVDAALTRFQERHLKIDKFRIEYPYFGVGEQHVCLSRVFRWTSIALERNAREISVGISSFTFTPGRTLPPSLHLSGSTGLPESSSLRVLALSGFKASEFLSWRGLMTACLSLRSLSLTECSLKEVRISGLPNLKSLSICLSRSTLVEIRAPSLESFCFDNDIRSERTGCVINMDHCPNLKSLTLSSVAEDGHWFRHLLSRFPRLRDLTVQWCYSLTRIRISNPLIESVSIEACRNLTDISIEAPELRQFHLYTLDGPLPSISIKNPPRSNPVAKVHVLFPVSVKPPPPDWSCKLREFLVGSCKSFSSLRVTANGKGYACELQSDIKYGWSGVIACSSEQLRLARRRGTTQEPLAKAVAGIDVKGLLWTPHPATVTAVAGGSSGDDFLQFFCDKAAERPKCSEEDCTAGYAGDAKIVIV